MFRITQDPSLGIIDSYLIKTTRNGSTVLVVCAVGVWRHIHDCNGEGNYVRSILKIMVKS
jgi:SH3-like domain-containing protein